jgi:molybdenum cofactor cytidylyltransferase
LQPRADTDPPQIGGVILAAGEARRFGSQKLLASIGGRPLVQHVIDAANASCLEDIVLVVGASADDLVDRLDTGRARIVRNPDPTRGLASSLQVGLRGLDERLHGAVVILADVPGVTTRLIDELVARGRETRAAAVVSVWHGRRSPPVVLHKSLWPAAFALQGDVGMREVLKDQDVIEFIVPDALGSLDDIDTKADHARLLRGR